MLSLALGASALHTFLTLQDLRDQYQRNRGREISSFLDRQVRGPGRRSSTAAWQEVLDQTLEVYEGTLQSVHLYSPQGELIAAAEAAAGEVDTIQLEFPALMSRGPRWDQIEERDGGRIVLRLRASLGESITRQAYVHLAVSIAAALLLTLLALYLWGTLKRYLELKVREASERHLAQLGRMSATLAHEIRNPLGAMKGLTQVIQEDLPSEHTAQSLMDTVVTEAERLETLVTDLLIFARPGQIQLQKVDISELAGEVGEFLEGDVDSNQLEIEAEGRPDQFSIHTDPNAFRQVLLNVLRNAFEASPRGTPVQLIIASKSGGVELQILDRGSGLGETDPEELFQPFRTTKTQGSGLGLAVSRQILERLQGRIELSNRPEGGTRCRIELPTMPNFSNRGDQS